MTTKNKKFLLLHVNEQDSRSVLRDAYEEGIQRGLVIKDSKLGKLITEQFNNLKNRGYFPVGLIIGKDDFVEFVFKRHPKQTKEMRLNETTTDNPLEL